VDQRESENRRLRDMLTTAKAEARANELIYRRSHERHLSLLQATSLGALFQAIVEGLREAYQLDAISLVIRDVQHEIRQLLAAENPHAASPSAVIFQEALESFAPQYNNLRQPWLGPFVGADHMLIFPGRDELGSCALLPLRRNGELIGCLNFGSRDPKRFTRHHAVDFLGHLADIAAVCLENAVNRSRLVRSGITDALTGLYNRRYLQHRLGDELARAQRTGRPLSCIIFDVDHFKPINDRWGHPAGDRVLAQIAHLIREECRASDIAIRYGGEEFAVLLPGTGTAEAMQVAERTRQAVAAGEVVLPSGEMIQITISAGVSCASPGPSGTDLKSLGDRLIAEADVQLYRAKAEGRDRVCGVAE
jgi:two-component system, cell cycle response regulator